jgi:aspartate beta-hydroxylase
LQILAENWQTIRDEGLAQMDPKSGSFKPEDENLRESGDWKQFMLFQRGQCRDDCVEFLTLTQVPASFKF